MLANDKVEANAQRAEHFAPAHVHRLVHHYHNLIYIRNYWDSLGLLFPKWVGEELDRTDREIQALLAEEKESGGFLHKRGER